MPGALILRLALVIGFAEGSGTNAMLNRFAAKLGRASAFGFPISNIAIPSMPEHSARYYWNCWTLAVRREFFMWARRNQFRVSNWV